MKLGDNMMENPFRRPFPVHPDMPDDWDEEQLGYFLGPRTTEHVKCSAMVNRQGVPGVCGHWAQVTWEGKLYCTGHNPFKAQIFDWLVAEDLIHSAQWNNEQYFKYKKDLETLGRELTEAREDKQKRERELAARLEVLLTRLEKLLGPAESRLHM